MPLMENEAGFTEVTPRTKPPAEKGQEVDRPPFFSLEIWLGGAVAGILAGIGMKFLSMILSALAGQGFWFPLQMIGGTVFGVDSIIGGFGVGLVGLGIHLGVSALFGLIFAELTDRDTLTSNAFLGGVFYGAVLWAFMNFLVLPWANPTMSERMNLVSGMFFAEHLVFGGLLAWTPALRRRFRKIAKPPVERLRRVA